MILLINKTDFLNDGDGTKRVVISENVAEDELNPHIRDSQRYDLQPIVPDAFYQALFASPVGAEMTVFLNSFIVPLLVFLSYNKYLLWLGKNPTQYGLKYTKDDTSETVGRVERAELMNETEGKVAIELDRFYKELERVNYTFDGVTYDFSCKKRKRFKRIRAV